MAEAPLEEPRGRRLLESVAAAGMELCWLYAAVSCLLRLGGLPPWPLRDALLPFLAAALPSAWGRGRGWRVWQLAALHLAAFLAAAAPVWARSRAEWARIASGAAAPGEWVAPLWGLVVLSAFWWSGLATARRSPSGRAVAARFDIGACVLAAVVLLGLLTRRPTPAVGSLLPAYFLFGLLAVSLARSRGTGTRSRPAGARATGLVFSVGLAAAVLGSALLFLLPLIQAAARVGYTVLRSAAVSLSPLLLAVLRFLLRLLSLHPPTVPPAGSAGAHGVMRPAQELAGKPGLLKDILAWGIMGATALTAVLLLGRGLWRLVRWLASRTPESAGRRRTHHLRSLLRGLAAAWNLLLRLFGRGARRPAGARRAFARLARWGGRSGAPRRPAETPLAYGRRLARRFPALEPQVRLIVESFSRELYAGRSPDREGELALRRSCRMLGDPRYWFPRLRGLLREAAAPDPPPAG